MELYATKYANTKGYTNINSLKKTKKVAFVDMFDFMAGTSTGSMITTGLSYPDKKDPTVPKYDMDALINVYRTRGPDLFKSHGGPSAGEIIVWVLFFIFWTGLFYFFGRYFYNWPYEVTRLDEAE
jgi:hypothetical protein